MHKKLLITSILATSGLPQLASAAELSQVLVSANQLEQSIQEVTAEVYIIDQQTLESKHYTTLIDALREVPGISFTRNGGSGASTNLYLRGSNNNRTLILLDGIRLNNPASTNGADLASISLANIERIEIIKGAQSGVWGADAAAGIINLISKKNDGHSVTLENGSYNTRKLLLNSQFNFGESAEHKFYIGAERLLSDGFSTQVPADEDIDQYEADGIAQTNVNAKLDFDLGANQHLLLSHNDTRTYGEYDGYQAPDSQQRYRNKTRLSSAIWRNQATEINLQQSLFSNQQLDSNATDIATARTQALNIKHQINQLVIGANYSRNKVETDKSNQQLADTNHSKAVFATYGHQFANWHFNEAIRLDNYSNFGSEVTSKIGAKYAFADKHHISANFGTAFNAPSLVQIINPYGPANPDLKPEQSRELSLSYQWHWLNLTYFDKHVTDLIGGEYTADGYKFVNIDGESRIEGAEVGIRQQIADFDIALNYNYLETEDPDGQQLARRPKEQIGFDVTWFINPQLDFNLNALYIGERQPSQYDSQSATTQYYTVVNTVFNYQANRQTRVYLKIDNLFNEYYQVVDGYGTAERSAYLGINYQF